jgi:hypothetical protein
MLFCAICSKAQSFEYNLKYERCITHNYNRLLFIDSVQVPLAFLNQIDPASVLEVSIVKDKNNMQIKDDGKIYVTLKKGYKKICMILLFLKRLCLKYPKPFLLMVNSFLINDYSSFVIDEKSIATV